jgi:putative phosphoribosyl transferase
MSQDVSISLPFTDRHEAGRILASRLTGYAHQPDVTVLGLARGGVPVGFEIAKTLALRFDVYVVRKLGVPGHKELAMGAIASGGVRVLNSKVLNRLSNAEKALRKATAKEEKELKRRERQYREGREFRPIEGNTVILVDDGLATGATMRAAAIAIRQLAVSRCVLAVPVGAPDACADLRDEADEVICATTPNPFYAVGQFYRDFSQTTDEEVRELLMQAESDAMNLRSSASPSVIVLDDPSH